LTASSLAYALDRMEYTCFCMSVSETQPKYAGNTTLRSSPVTADKLLMFDVCVCVCVCVLGALMHELEAILHEYLSFNWDRMEEVNTANAPLQRKEGLACPWRPSKDIQHSVSTAAYSQSPC